MQLEKRRLFPSFGFVLSHDVDRIAYHQIREVLHKVKLIFHSKSNFKKTKWLVRQFFNGRIAQMEMSVLDYSKLSNNQLQILVLKYMKKPKKFGGIFSLLWHNCRLNYI
ncbi:MAG: hypothetical protein ACOCV9_04460 [Marinilabiliaceae bacterium]